MYTFQNLNQALIGMSKELIQKGVKRKTRGYDCIELPTPILICIENPIDRYITIPERKWNKILPFVESLWIALGINNLDVLPGNYVKNLYNFSDDGHTWRAGYGCRIRAFSGLRLDYNISDHKTRNQSWYGQNTGSVDQLKFVIESLKRDIRTRQALITIHDPAKDDFDLSGNLKVTKDQPCTRSIHFQVNNFNELDCIVDIRSNDLLWGFSAINVFNFTWMQEYVANILGLKIGKYYHKADNFHYYDNYTELIQTLSQIPISEKITDKFQYSDIIGSLEEFDDLIDTLFNYEKELRIEKHKHLVDFNNDMFNDWGRVFYHYHTKNNVEFNNPYLNNLFYGN